jgi:hypothetical protein
MARQMLNVFLFLLLIVPTSDALEIPEAVVTTAVVQRAPVDVVDVLNAADISLFCFTRVAGAEPPTRIEHVWFRGEQQMARVTLPVNAPEWRTWSSKRVLPDWQGAWRVEVLDAEGTLLQTVEFELQ